jgi:hypothetical protein
MNSIFYGGNLNNIILLGPFNSVPDSRFREADFFGFAYCIQK